MGCHLYASSECEWDQHNGLATAHADNLGILDSMLGEFYAQMQQLGLLDAVTLFTASDFGRALRPNGDGTDHAWGGNQIVLGGAVNGGNIYGQYPKMKLMTGTGSTDVASANADADNLDIVGNGTLMPTLSVDQYMQRLGLQVNAGHGLTVANLPDLFGVPHLAELYIGHHLVSRAMTVGLEAAVKEMLAAMSGYPAEG